MSKNQETKGKLTEFVAVQFLTSLGYKAERGSIMLDQQKIDVVAKKEGETIYAQVKSGQISNKEIEKIVKSVHQIDSDENKSVAIIANEFSKNAETIRDSLHKKYDISIYFYHGYQVIKALPEYKQALS
jgi:HJR/Mrr/RecB family endonuclease